MVNSPSSVKPSDLAAISRVTWLGFVANLALSALKLTIGLTGSSKTLVADGVHSLSDLATDAIVLVGARYWSRPADADHPNGHAKMETLATFVVGLALALVAFELMRGAVVGLAELAEGTAKTARPAGAAFFAALVSIFVKEALYRATISVGRRTRSSAVVANAWHHRSDALSSIPASLAIGGCWLLGPKFAFLDPVGTVVVGFMVLRAAFEIVRPTVSTLCDASADAKIVEQIRQIALDSVVVQSAHKIRTRPIGASLFAVDLHILVDPETPVRVAHRLSHGLEREIRLKLPQIVETSIHVEPLGDVEEEDATAINDAKTA